MQKVDIDHIARVEGHGNLKVKVEGSKVEARMEVTEAPRFFEAILVGRNWDEAYHITSRICGICSSSHSIASVKALEDALSVRPSKQTVLLRKLLLCGETIQSHTLHTYFLALPDFLGKPSVISLADTHLADVQRGLKLKELGNRICEVVGGRSVHPISAEVGGFSKLPSPGGLRSLREELIGARIGAEVTVELFSSFKVPIFERKTEYISLRDKREFAVYDGTVTSTEGWKAKPIGCRERIREKVLSYSTSKQVQATKDSYMVGALARININGDRLNKRATKVKGVLGLATPSYNSFLNNQAQVVELVQAIEDAIDYVDRLLDMGLEEKRVEVRVREGEGSQAVEAPRGILFHEYAVGKNGRIRKANVITPTAQNLANIETDVEAILPSILNKSKDEIILTLEKLIRAYDPCISCSAHQIKLEFA